MLLIGCSKEETFENFFHTAMDKQHKEEKDHSYSLIHKEMDVVHKNDAIAIFKENRSRQEVIFIAYFEYENGQWNWRQTRGAEWDSLINWTSMNHIPYIYSGAITDKSIFKVVVDEELAKVIEVEDNKRFWYAVSDIKDVEVKVIKNDGTEEIIEEYQ